MSLDCNNEIIKTGRIIFELGLVGSHSGNISCINNGRIYITASGSKLGWLEPKEIVSFSIDDKAPHPKASSEYLTHWEIYKKTDYKCVIHSHPHFLVVLSLTKEKVVPIDIEGKYYLSEIPILHVKEAIGSSELAEKVSNSFVSDNRAVMVKGHGLFVAADDFEEGINLSSVSESSSKILYHHSLLTK